MTHKISPTVSVIIVHYKTKLLTLQCLKSIYEQVQDIDFEVIVVDNASQDGIEEAIKTSFPSVIFIASSENLGFGRANNLAATKATGDYLFFLNSDTILFNNPFPFFFEFIQQQQDSAVGALGAAFLTDKEGNYAQSGGSCYSARKYLKNAARRWLSLDFVEEIDSKSTENLAVDYVIGADLFLSRALFNDVGGFDPKIFLYFEDVELCKRIQLAGYQSFLVQGPHIQHLINSSSTSQNTRLFNTASLMYCLSKEMSTLGFLGFQFAYFCLKLPVLIKGGNSFSENIQYLFSIFSYKKYLVHQ